MPNNLGAKCGLLQWLAAFQALSQHQRGEPLRPAQVQYQLLLSEVSRHQRRLPPQLLERLQGKLLRGQQKLKQCLFYHRALLRVSDYQRQLLP